jgi:hypothetical protein
MAAALKKNLSVLVQLMIANERSLRPAGCIVKPARIVIGDQIFQL